MIKWKERGSRLAHLIMESELPVLLFISPPPHQSCWAPVLILLTLSVRPSFTSCLSFSSCLSPNCQSLNTGLVFLAEQEEESHCRGFTLGNLVSSRLRVVVSRRRCGLYSNVFSLDCYACSSVERKTSGPTVCCFAFNAKAIRVVLLRCWHM